jgi:hypothetical protein
MVGHWCFLRLSRPVSCQAARGQQTQTRNHNNSRVDNERLRRLKRTRRNKLAEDGSHQWHAYVCMIAAPAAASRRSSVALHLVRMPGCTRGKINLQHVATMKRAMSHNNVPKHQLKAGRVTKVNVNTRPGEPKANPTTSACNASVVKKMLGFSPGSGSGN